VIGVVPITSLGALAQRTPGASVRFASVTIDEVRESRRAWEHRLVGFVRSV
jgi:allophanate hydrolase subunit 2